MDVQRRVDAFLEQKIWDDGGLVDEGELPLESAEHRRQRAELLDQMRANAWALNTRKAYSSHVRAWIKWALEEGVPPLLLRPDDVCNHLADYAVQWNPDGTVIKDAEGNEVAAVAMSTISQRLAALNKLADYCQVAAPADDPGVQRIMAGLRRTFGTYAKYRKAALDLDRVQRCLEATTGATLAAQRTHVTLLLRWHTAATAGQIAALQWENVRFSDSGVAIVLPPTSRFGAAEEVRIRAHKDTALCLAEALRALQRIQGATKYVVAHPDGTAMSRQHVHRIVSKVLPWDSPKVNAAELTRLLASESRLHPMLILRDRALLLVGFFTALRRSNLSAMNWSHVQDLGPDGISIFVPFSKTDQTGNGRTVWLPQSDDFNDPLCPATALRVWRSNVERELGRPVLPADPVFASVDKDGGLRTRAKGAVLHLRRLNGEAINDIVQGLADAAGLTSDPTSRAAGTSLDRNPYGAHSLRAGFITEGLRDDRLSIAEVQEVTGHASVNVLIGYRREVNSAKRNGSRKLLKAIKSGAE